MQDERALKSNSVQMLDIGRVIELPLAGCDMADWVLIEQVFSMGQDNVRPEQVESLIHDGENSGCFTGANEVGWIDDNLEFWCLEFVEKADSSAGGINDVIEFGFDPQEELLIVCDGDGRFERGEERAPGFDGAVIRMGFPHVVRVACPGAECDEIAAKGRAD